VIAVRPLTQLGLVLHPRRELDGALHAIRDWASRHGVAVGQVAIPRQPQRMADHVDVASCDLLIAVGGDGTTLAALHAGADASRPVLGVAAGSIGVLTSVHVDDVSVALDQVAEGNSTSRALPALHIRTGTGEVQTAINDFAVIRDGTGQVITGIKVDDELYVRTAGDGVVVATQLGSSAYTMAAGGPILAPGAQGIVITPLANHGGVAPPLVVGPESRLVLSVAPGYGGARFEADGQVLATEAAEVTVTLVREYATMVTLGDQEPMFTSLRRRGLVVDGPRILVRDKRTPRPST
jgi:NAD+ kinase